MNKVWLVVLCMALAGCATRSQLKPESLVTPPVSRTISVEPQTEKSANNESQAKTHLAMDENCMSELAALKTYSPKSWNKYNAEMRQLTRKSSQFESVREGISQQLNELVLHSYESRMQTLCYRIESTLGQIMVSQATHL